MSISLSGKQQCMVVLLAAAVIVLCAFLVTLIARLPVVPGPVLGIGIPQWVGLFAVLCGAMCRALWRGIPMQTDRAGRNVAYIAAGVALWLTALSAFTALRLMIGA